jgi:hypothetical protein
VTKPSWFEPKFTIGNVIQILVIVLGGFTAWNSLTNDITDMKAKAEAREVRVQKLESDGIIKERQQQSEQIELTKQLADISADLRYLRAAFDDLRRSASTSYGRQ